MKPRIEISKITAEVKAQGNGAHVTVPKYWIGKTVVVIPADSMETSEKQENKFVSKVAKEVGENLTKGKTRGKK